MDICRFRSRWSLFILTLVMMAGCSTPYRTVTTTPPPEVSPTQTVPVEVAPPVVVMTPPIQKAPDSGLIAQSAAKVSEQTSPSAISSLLQIAESRYASGQYDSAIATAERALRIDRFSGQAYLILAKSYWAKRSYAQAAQSARQGVQYAPQGSILRQELERYQNAP